MTKNRIRFYISLAAVLVAFCVIALVVPFVRTAAFWLSLGFGVLAIAVQLYTMPNAMNGSTLSKFYGFPILRISFIYLAAQLVLSLLFMALAKLVPVWVPTVLYLVLLCAALIGFVGADSVRDEVVRQDDRTKQQVSVMRDFQSQVANLSINCDESCKAELDKLADEFRYSDPVSSDAITDAEDELRCCIDELQRAVAENQSEDISRLCRKTSLVLAERNRLCKLNKA